MSGTIADWERERFHREAGDEIAGLPEADERVYVVERELGPGEPVVLMERSCGGWSVELRLTAEGHTAILAQQGEGARPEGCVVPPEKALDAFHHPYCYLPV